MKIKSSKLLLTLVLYFIYSPDGYMSAQIFPTDRNWKPATATLKELQDTIAFGTSYDGKYEIDWGKKQVTHKVAGNIDPTAATAINVRHFKLSGNTLVLTGPWEYNGQTLTFEITWVRDKLK